MSGLRLLMMCYNVAYSCFPQESWAVAKGFPEHLVRLALTMISQQINIFFLPSLWLFWTFLPILLFTVPLLCRSFLLSRGLSLALTKTYMCLLMLISFH